ncbi:MAG: hypothetical protein WAN65_01775 [Candidatus Sulfotelmatobacter sp.]
MPDFAFEPALDTLDNVPAEFQPAYVKGADGKFALGEPYKPFANAIVGSNTSLARARADLKNANKESADRRTALKAFEDLAGAVGVTVADGKTLPEAIREHVEDLSTKVKNGGEIKVNMDNIRRDYEKKVGETKAEADKRVEKMGASLAKHLIGDATTAALAKHGGSIPLLSGVVKSQVKVVTDENGDYVTRVMDSDGNARSNGAGGWLSIDDLVAELKRNTEYAAAFKSETGGGSGTPAARKQTGTGMRQQDTSKMSATDKIKLGLGKGQFEKNRGR